MAFWECETGYSRCGKLFELPLQASCEPCDASSVRVLSHQDCTSKDRPAKLKSDALSCGSCTEALPARVVLRIGVLPVCCPVVLFLQTHTNCCTVWSVQFAWQIVGQAGMPSLIPYARCSKPAAKSNVSYNMIMWQIAKTWLDMYAAISGHQEVVH